MNQLVYFTPLGKLIGVLAVLMFVWVVGLWISSRPKHNGRRTYGVFGYQWQFNAVFMIIEAGMWFLLPTISVLHTDAEQDNHDVDYWSIDFTWLKYVISFEILRR